jgi:hypothetical protein
MHQPCNNKQIMQRNKQSCSATTNTKSTQQKTDYAMQQTIMQCNNKHKINATTNRLCNATNNHAVQQQTQHQRNNKQITQRNKQSCSATTNRLRNATNNHAVQQQSQHQCNKQTYRAMQQQKIHHSFEHAEMYHRVHRLSNETYSCVGPQYFCLQQTIHAYHIRISDGVFATLLLKLKNTGIHRLDMV